MITERLINYAIHLDEVAGLVRDTALSVQIQMTANGIRAIADDIAQMPVYVPPLRLVRDGVVVRGPWTRAEGVA